MVELLFRLAHPARPNLARRCGCTGCWRPVGRHHLRTDACQEFQKVSSLTLEAVDCILITAHAMAARAPPRALATEVPDPSGMYTRNYKINNDASFHIIGLAVRKTRSNRPDVSPCSCGSRSAWLPREAIIQPMSAWDKSRIPRRHLWIRHKTNAKTCLFQPEWLYPQETVGAHDHLHKILSGHPSACNTDIPG